MKPGFIKLKFKLIMCIFNIKPVIGRCVCVTVDKQMTDFREHNFCVYTHDLKTQVMPDPRVDSKYQQERLLM